MGTSVNQSITTATPVAVNFDTDIYDPQNMHNPSTNNTRIVIPSNGIYEFIYSITFDVNSTGARGGWLRINGDSNNRIGSFFFGATTAVTTAATGSIILKLNAGDYVEAVAYQSSGGALNIVGNATFTYSTTLSCAYLGNV